jgi:hypothetical protein
MRLQNVERSLFSVGLIMAENDNTAWDRLEYTLISITRITPPFDITDETWFQYIIGRADNCIKGMSQGSLEEVTEHAEDIVYDLNARRNLKMGPLWRTKKV